MIARPTILVAPLDWGLGHATRCIPLVQALLSQGCEVLLASHGPQALLLREAFPGLAMLPLHGYEVQYSRKAVLAKVLSQVPHIIRCMSREHLWLQQVVKQYKIDFVISDNRYGLWSPQCKSILLTHQLALPVPKGWAWAKGLLRTLLYRQIEQFTECWVPDIADSNPSLSAALGHPAVMPKLPVHYMGWLSRFDEAAQTGHAVVRKLVIVLSGPEPQRTMLEQLLLSQFRQIAASILLVRGLPGEANLPKVPEQVEVVNHLPGKALQMAMLQSEFVLARGGYSTLMDAFTLKKKCIFIPTPGQTEQEYLCEVLMEKQAALCYPQSDFFLPAALAQAEKFSYQLPAMPAADGLKSFVQQALNRLMN